ncbi:hypothetical protein AAE478_005781 [Parahypoxylon ruwenzoriense]
MWSYIQYRRMERDLENVAKRNSEAPSYQNAQDAVLDDVEGARAEPFPPGILESKENGHRSTTGQRRNKIVVDVEGDHDPLDPRNWSLVARSKNIAILSFLIFVQGWAGAAESMANKTASEEFGVSQVAENLSTAMYLFGIGSGAFFAGPLSETVGRNPTYLVSTFFFLLFVLGSALTPTFGGQVVCRYFVGLFSSATLSINGSSVRDQFRPVKRAFVFPIIAWANVAETYLPLLIDWKVRHLRRITGDRRYVSKHGESASLIRRLRHVGPLPARFLTREPVVAVLGGYLMLLYILLFSFLSGFDYIFKETYGLTNGLTGSCFASIAAGATFFTLLAPSFYSWARWKTEYVRGSSIEPEFRLWPAIIAAPLLPVSLFWLGWGNQDTISIWSSLGACFVFGMVIIAIYVSSYEYIIDSYGDHAAIGLASLTIIRYLVAGGMVMAARPMYGGIGTHWTLTLLGCIAVVLLPAPLVFWKCGRQLRSRSPYAKSPGT